MVVIVRHINVYRGFDRHAPWEIKLAVTTFQGTKEEAKNSFVAEFQDAVVVTVNHQNIARKVYPHHCQKANEGCWAWSANCMRTIGAIKRTTDQAEKDH
jgi:hypothetical protein